MFSGFWAAQIFFVKLGFIAGAMVLPFQAVLLISATITLTITLLPKAGSGFIQLYKEKPALFWKLFLANGIQSGLGSSLSFVGIAMTDAINAGFLLKLTAVTTTLFAWMFLKERMSWIKIFIIITMLSGAYLLSTKGQLLYPKTGDLFILGACFCWSLGNVFVRKILKEQTVNADVVTLQKPVAGLPIFLVLFGISAYFPGKLELLSPVLACCSFSTQALPYALIGGFCLAGAWIYLYRTLKISTASYLTLMSMITPVLVSILAIGFLGERLVWVQIVGAAMILLSGLAIYFSDIVKT